MLIGMFLIALEFPSIGLGSVPWKLTFTHSIPFKSKLNKRLFSNSSSSFQPCSIFLRENIYPFNTYFKNASYMLSSVLSAGHSAITRMNNINNPHFHGSYILVGRQAKSNKKCDLKEKQSDMMERRTRVREGKLL